MNELIESLKKLLAEYARLGVRQQLDYEKFYLYSIVTQSTAIEGSTITEIENQLMFDEGICAEKPLGEQLMNIDLKKAYDKAFNIAESRSLEDVSPFMRFMFSHHAELLCDENYCIILIVADFYIFFTKKRNMIA